MSTKKLFHSLKKLEQAQNEFIQTAKAELTPGTIVRWEHGNYQQEGHVLWVSGHGAITTVGIKNSRTKREISLDIRRITDYGA